MGNCRLFPRYLLLLRLFLLGLVLLAARLLLLARALLVALLLLLVCRLLAVGALVRLLLVAHGGLLKGLHSIRFAAISG